MLILVASLSCGASLPGAVPEIPVLDDAAALPKFRERARELGRVHAADLMKGTEGRLLDGASESELSRGRYRLHVGLAISPLGHQFISDIAVTTGCGGGKLVVTSLDFLRSDEPIDVSLDFVVTRSGRAPVAVAWSVGEQAKLNRAKAKLPGLLRSESAAPLDEGKAGKEDDEELILEFEQSRDGTISLDDLKSIEFCLSVHYAVIQPLSPLAITRLQPDKLHYRPGERGSIHLTVRNYGDKPVSERITVELAQELADSEVLAEKDVQVAARSEERFQIPCTASGRFGTGVRATIHAKPVPHCAADYFSVADNFWEVAFGYGTPVHTHTDKYRELPEHMRANYLNWLDVFFWAPCDWACLVSPLKRWWGGQCDYPHDEENLKDLIRLCHAQGMKLAAYCSKNAAGPFGWEVARQHPEWFTRSPLGGINGSYHVRHLDLWNDAEWRASTDDGNYRSDETRWYGCRVDLRRVDALDWGIDQIIQSAKHYGWDAVRFDGHYTIIGNDDVSTRNMRRLKERVWKELPDFRFGFNYGRGPEWHGGITHEIREAMAGGGMYMQEGIRNWRYTGSQYSSWRHYATNELRTAKQIQSLGGSYHCISDLQGLSEPQAFYKLVYGLIAGAHPCYGSFVGLPGCPNWGAFMTRWSSMLWDPGLRVLEAPRERFIVDAERIQWEPFVQERIASEKRKFVILHLVTPPPSDRIAQTAFPLPPKPPTVRYTPEPDTKVSRVYVVRPDEGPVASELVRWPETDPRGRVVVKVPEMRLWAMVVWEIRGKFTLPTVPPKFTEPPDPVKVADAEKRSLITRTDPNKQAIQEETGPGVIVHLLNHGSANIGKPLTFDPESEVGTVHWRDKKRRSARLGSWWFERIPPGKHRISLRFKWTDALPRPTPQKVSVEIINEGGKGNPRSILVTPGYPDPPAGAKTLGQRGRYQYYEIGTFERTRAGYIHAVCHATTAKVGDNALYLDKIKVEAVGGNSDGELAQYYHLVPKPAGLRVPDGANPGRVLFVKGMFWQQYAARSGIEMEMSYAVPTGYEQLYAHDCVVLCNIDFSRADLPTRKVLKDYVEDGGRLVLLGGCFALGQGGIRRTFLDEVLPVACAGPCEVVRCDPPLLLGSAPGKPHPQRPAIFWRHQVSPRPGSTTLAWAGTRPIAVAGRYGKGYTGVFAGTVLGQGGDGVRAFWETSAWSDLLKQLSRAAMADDR